MKLFTIIAGVLTVVVAYGGATVRAQQPQSPSKEFMLKVDAKDIEILSEGLGLLPYNKVAPLFGKLQQQISAQAIPAPIQANPQPPKE